MPQPLADKPDRRCVRVLAIRDGFLTHDGFGKRQAVSVLPSVASLRVLRLRKAEATKAMVGFGDPIFDPAERARALADREATKSGWSPDPILGWGSSSRRRIQSNLLVVHGRVIGLPGIPAITWHGNTRAPIFDLLNLLAHRHGSWR
jgi:hypothetical protein